MIDRRQLLIAGGALAAAGVAGRAEARVLPSAMVPLIGPGYRPVDADERGMWQQMERVEEEIAGSNLVVQEPALNAYLKGLIGKVGGPAARDFRIYLVRIPDFNAVMFPTGMAVIFTGLLLRMRNEAQLAGVIAHEAAHFLRKHQIRQWRDMRTQDRFVRDAGDGRGGRGRRGGGLRPATIVAAWRSSGRSCRCCATIACSRPRPMRWGCGCWPSRAMTRARWPRPGRN